MARCWWTFMQEMQEAWELLLSQVSRNLLELTREIVRPPALASKLERQRAHHGVGSACHPQSRNHNPETWQVTVHCARTVLYTSGQRPYRWLSSSLPKSGIYSWRWWGSSQQCLEALAGEGPIEALVQVGNLEGLFWQRVREEDMEPTGADVIVLIVWIYTLQMRYPCQ